MIINDRPTVTISGAAKLAGVSKRTIYNWLASGKLEAVRTAGGLIRVFNDSLFKEFDSSELRQKKEKQ